ncbi:MAG TPA: MFS transporter [Nitrososphaerales archaeon]|nr:MFS transporter [Nitrososphaerales archaeon]
MLSEYRGIPSQAKLLIYLSFIPNVAIGFIYSDLAYFLPRIQGLSPTLSGIVITVMGLTLVAESVPLGIVADRYGRRKMLLLGNLCASLSLIGFALTSNFFLLLLVAVLEGTGETAYAVSVSALLAEKAGDTKRTSAFSLLAFLGWIASGFGGFVIASVASLQGFGFGVGEAHVLLYVAIGVLNLGVTPFLFYIKEGRSYNRVKEILPRKSGPVILRYLLYSVLIALGAGLFVPIMSYWFSAAYGVTDVISVPVLGVTSILTAFVVFMSPRLARRFGLVKATVLTQASSTVFMLLIPSSPTFAVAASIYVVRVLLMNLSNPLTQSLIMGLVSPDERGMASGITAALWRLPNAVTTTIGLTLVGAGYLALPFYIATVLYVVGISIFWVVFKDAKLPEEAPKGAQALAQSSRVEGPEVER